MELSQSLSMLLRHQARELSIPIDPFGWVDLEHALAHVNSYEGDDALEGGFPATAEEVRQVVLSSDKQRFGLRGPSHDAIKPEQLDSAAWPHLGRWHAHVAFLRTSHLRRSSYPAGVEPLCGTGTALQSAAVGQKGVQQHAMLSGSVAGLSRKAAKTRAMELSQSLSMLLRHQARELSIQ